MPAAEMVADYELPLMSIPARLNIVDPAVLAKLPPVSVSENLLNRWQKIVSDAVAARTSQNLPLARRPRIGLAISGAAHRKDNQLRSLPSDCIDAIIGQEEFRSRRRTGIRCGITQRFIDRANCPVILVSKQDRPTATETAGKSRP